MKNLGKFTNASMEVEKGDKTILYNTVSSAAAQTGNKGLEIFLLLSNNLVA